MNEILFCKDCKHFMNNTFLSGTEHGRCRRTIREVVGSVNVVSGKKEPTFLYYDYCSTERIFGCGPQARYWEPNK